MRATVVTGEWSPRAGARLTDEERAGHWALDATTAWRHPRWQIGERETPQLRGPTDVLVKVRAVGICGSDVHLFETDADGYVLLPYRVRLPVVPGHEIAGEVVEVGRDVRDVGPGDAVAVQTLHHCGRCAACRAGLPSHCSDAEDSGFSIDGGMAEYVLSRESNVRSLDPLRDRYDESDLYAIGALCEPASVAYVGMFLRAGGFLPGGTVAVHGCGPIGLAAVALARAAGASRVLAFDTEIARCKLAEQVGADTGHHLGTLRDAGDAVADVILQSTRGAGVDLTVEAAGAAATVLPDVERSIAVGGKVVLLGSESGAAPLQTMAYMLRGASLHGSIGNIGGLDPVIALHAAGRIDLRPIVSASYDLDDGVEAIRRAALRQDAKILVLPNGGARPA
ncbi:scyllo-inosose 3-dehydrogenase [Cryptosporangium sp. NPDC051539]|uniref:scyllo-inosose 3-dehydrogenase n=1 Tax=Cryptosporangium sp. NPDC051539 TaxID=3363962 RepID=UPI00378DDE12